MLGKADILIALEQRQVPELRKLCPTKRVIHCPYSPAVFELLGSPPMSRELLFVGNLYDPNVRGLAAFLKDDWPTLRDEGCKLTVIGRVSEAFQPTEGVTFAGFVETLRPFYGEVRGRIEPRPLLYRIANKDDRRSFSWEVRGFDSRGCGRVT